MSVSGRTVSDWDVDLPQEKDVGRQGCDKPPYRPQGWLRRGSWWINALWRREWILMLGLVLLWWRVNLLVLRREHHVNLLQAVCLLQSSG